MQSEGLGSRLIVLSLAAVLAWGFGITAAMLAETALPDLLDVGMPATFMVIIVFVFSLLFFGYPSPFIMFVGGLFAGNHARAAGIDTYVALLSFACILAAYSSIRLGDALLGDMVGKGNFERAVKISAITAAAAMLAGMAIDLIG